MGSKAGLKLTWQLKSAYLALKRDLEGADLKERSHTSRQLEDASKRAAIATYTAPASGVTDEGPAVLRVLAMWTCIACSPAAARATVCHWIQPGCDS